MKTPILKTKSNNKSAFFLVILLAFFAVSFSQSKLVLLVSILNIEWTFAVICVTSLFTFLIVSFMKQKNH